MSSVHLARLLAASILITAAAAQSPCPPNGLFLQAAGGRLGDHWSIDLGGPPGSFGLLGFDLAQGPTPTPIGTVCLGVTPHLSLLSFVTGPLGDAHFQGLMPANGALSGLRVYTAAAAVDPTRPSGFATSNGGLISAFPPRLFFLDPGTLTPFGSTPGGYDALDMVTGNVLFSNRLTTQVRDAVYVREQQWLVLLLGNGTVAGFDGFSGLPVFNATLSGQAASASRIAAVPGGSQLLLLAYGTAPSPFSAGTPGSLHVLAVPSGTLISSIPLGAGNPDDLVLVPGSNLVYLRVANGVVPVDRATSTLFPTILLPTGFGGFIDWQLAGNRLWCLQSGQAASPFSSGQPAALAAVDVNAMALLFNNPLSMPAPVDFLRAGPGTTGPSLYVYGSLAGVLQEFDQLNGTPWGALPIGTGVADMRLSSLGSQWLILCTGAGCGGPTLLGMWVGTLLVSPLSPLPTGVQRQIAVLPTASCPRACLVAGSNIASPFATDPFVALTGSVTLPVSTASTFQIISD